MVFTYVCYNIGHLIASTLGTTMISELAFAFCILWKCSRKAVGQVDLTFVEPKWVLSNARYLSYNHL